ncbi:DUF1680 family protein [Microbacterium testaceum]|uniref:glycoside hydrolase family 127 protein n=1 Tax=Microbacterium testaceum TaxID=2033 RepID=UPI002786AC9E|nr:beta-L-arabinofuranosidase domain-containing protein [Microbacterium testaceum]MDQ1172033.1 DUF1680 family protein [Microbacterium testaceum]
MTLSLSESTFTTGGSRSSGRPVSPSRSDRDGVSLSQVVLDPGGFWGSRQLVNAEATLWHCLQWMEELGWIENFDRIARGARTDERAGWMFSDSEIYKLLEAMAWELAVRPTEALSAEYRSLVSRVAAAQDPDGYVGTAFGHPGLPPRYSDLAMGHELYNIGHLLQAAVARLRTEGEDLLVDVARRAADHVCREFAEGRREGICGHPEIEVGLAEFARATGERRYLDQARLFVERRGRGSLPVRPLLSAEYFQDDVPVREAAVLRGHAVRALYLSAGATDVAVEDRDGSLLAALAVQWRRTVERRTYITGGMGSRHQDEGFGEDFELPSDRAYCETCAGVASIMFSWRLYLSTGDVHYADLIERTLFNVIAVSPSLDGRAFFYANTLHQREAGSEAVAGVNTRAEGSTRAPWFDVSCCPTNVARTLASLPAYFASEDQDGVSLLQYAAGEIDAGGFRLRVETDYPRSGSIRITVVTAPAEERRVRLRVPEWADGAVLRGPDGAERLLPRGWADVRRSFAAGDVIDLDLPMAPRMSFPDARVDAVRGAVAIERGPVVLCAESVDLPEGVGIDEISVEAGGPVETTLDGARIRARVRRVASPGDFRPAFGGDTRTESDGTVEVGLIPYHRWAGRGPSTMRVFLPLSDARTPRVG